MEPFCQYAVSWCRRGCTEAQMSIFDHARAGPPKPGPTIVEKQRLSPGVAILAIGGLSALSWAFIILMVMALRSAL